MVFPASVWDLEHKKYLFNNWNNEKVQFIISHLIILFLLKKPPLSGINILLRFLFIKLKQNTSNLFDLTWTYFQLSPVKLNGKSWVPVTKSIYRILGFRNCSSSHLKISLGTERKILAYSSTESSCKGYFGCGSHSSGSQADFRLIHLGQKEE